MRKSSFKAFSILLTTILLFSFISAIDYPSTSIDITWAGNLTNLSQLSDTNIDGSQTDNQALAWDSATSKWIAQTISGAGGGDFSTGDFFDAFVLNMTNTEDLTTLSCKNISGAVSDLCTVTGGTGYMSFGDFVASFNSNFSAKDTDDLTEGSSNFYNNQTFDDNLRNFFCTGTDKAIGVYSNGTIKCGTDSDSGSSGADGNASSICNGNTTYLSGDDSCNDVSLLYEVQLNDEAGLYAVLSDVDNFIEENDSALLTAVTAPTAVITTYFSSYQNQLDFINTTDPNQWFFEGFDIYMEADHDVCITGGNCLSQSYIDTWKLNYTDYYTKAEVDNNFSLFSDTNESIRFNNLTSVDCSGTDKVVGVYDNGTIKCGVDSEGAGEDSFSGTNYTIFTGLIQNDSYLSTYNFTYANYATNVSLNYSKEVYDNWNTKWSSSSSDSFSGANYTIFLSLITNSTYNWTNDAFTSFDSRWSVDQNGNLSEDDVEAYIFDSDNTANLDMNYYNITNVNYTNYNGGGYIYDNGTALIIGRA